MGEATSPLAALVLPPLGWLMAGLWGAMWGSFFNVAIHRVGLYESVLRPRSRCTSCGAGVAAYDNVPIMSWLLLRGRCRRCRAPISARYPLVEALAVALALAVYARFVAYGDGEVALKAARFFVYFAFAGALLVLSGIDLDHKLLPDRITYPAVPIFFVAQLLLGDVAPLACMAGMVLGYGLVALTAELSYWILKREGMGYGDAKLLMLVGALLGWRGAVFAFFGAPFIGLLVVVPAMLLRRQRLMGVEIPFGPFLAAAATLYLLLRPVLPFV